MKLLSKLSNFILYGIVFSAVSSVVSVLHRGDFSLHTNEVSADVPPVVDTSCTTSDGDSDGGCGCSCDSDGGAGGGSGC